MLDLVAARLLCFLQRCFVLLFRGRSICVRQSALGRDHTILHPLFSILLYSSLLDRTGRFARGWSCRFYLCSSCRILVPVLRHLSIKKETVVVGLGWFFEFSFRVA